MSRADRWLMEALTEKLGPEGAATVKARVDAEAAAGVGFIAIPELSRPPLSMELFEEETRESYADYQARCAAELEDFTRRWREHGGLGGALRCTDQDCDMPHITSMQWGTEEVTYHEDGSVTLGERKLFGPVYRRDEPES